MQHDSYLQGKFSSLLKYFQILLCNSVLASHQKYIRIFLFDA